MGIVFAILSACTQATSYIFIKRGFAKLKPAEAFVLQAFWGVLLWIPLTLLLGFSWSMFWLALYFAFLSAVLSEAFVYYVLSKGEIAVTGTIFSTYSVYTVLFSMLINNERPSLLQLQFIGIAILGTIILSLPKRLRIEDIKNTTAIWPVLGAISVGFADTLGKRIIDESSFSLFLFCVAIAQVPVSYAYLRLQGFRLRKTVRKVKSHFGQYKFFILGALLNVISVMFLWLSFSLVYASLASPIQASYPFILAILAWMFLKERMTTQKIIGITITLTGVIGIAYSTLS